MDKLYIYGFFLLQNLNPFRPSRFSGFARLLGENWGFWTVLEKKLLNDTSIRMNGVISRKKLELGVKENWKRTKIFERIFFRENIASQNFSVSCRITYSKQDVRRNHYLRKFEIWKIAKVHHLDGAHLSFCRGFKVKIQRNFLPLELQWFLLQVNNQEF